MSDHNPILARIDILLQQKKYTDAEKLLKDLLRDDPHHILYLSTLAQVYIQMERTEEAEQLIDDAISHAPEDAWLLQIKARVLVQRDAYDQAEESMQQAIRLDPIDDNSFAYLGLIKLDRKQFQEALDLANQALELNPENLIALNVRSTALLKLDRKEDSFETIEGALREDPNNSYTHANYGWGLLEKGDHKKAKEHFQEALRHDPTNEYAQAGMLTALKASNPVYRLFLKYAFWIGNLTAKYQWGVILGFYFGMRFLRNLSRENEALQPFLGPILIAGSVLAFSTWIINPVSNLFLRFNRYGKYLLSKKEKLSSNFVAVAFVIFLGGLLAYLVSQDERFLPVTFFGFAMMPPLGTMFSPSKNKFLLLAYTIGMAGLGIFGLTTLFTTGKLPEDIATIFVFGFIGYQFLANFLLIREDNR